MSVVFSASGLLTFALLMAGYIWWSMRASLHALSLPCVMILTTIVYFYLMPLAYLADGDFGFYGSYLTTMDRCFWAVALYAAGALLACAVRPSALVGDPRIVTGREGAIRWQGFWTLAVLAGAGVLAKIYLGQLNFTGDDIVSVDVQNLNFLQLSDSIIIALVVVYLVYDKFHYRSLLALLVALAIFLTDGFRFRIVNILAATVIAFMIQRNIKIRTLYVVGGSLLGITVLNAIGMSRKYGQGVDLSHIQGKSFTDLFLSYGSEIGPVFVMNNMANIPPPKVLFDPWIVAVTRLVPSFIWPTKPFPDYALFYTAGFDDPRAVTAGIAATQQSEFFLQFGWIGLPVLAFLFYTIALAVQKQLKRLAPEVRIAGTALIPPLFGFCAQQRGYSFQVLYELLFTLGPLWIISRRGAAVRD